MKDSSSWGCCAPPKHTYACKICKRELFTDHELLHPPAPGLALAQQPPPGGAAAADCASYFTAAPGWLAPLLSELAPGDPVLCPRLACQFKVGFYCAETTNCSCGAPQPNSIRFVRAK